MTAVTALCLGLMAGALLVIMACAVSIASDVTEIRRSIMQMSVTQ